MDVEGRPEENCPNNILENYDFGSMPDEKFHRLMNMNDPSYCALFADKVFENTVWNEYEDKEILNVRSISSSEGNDSVFPEILIQSKDKLLNGASPEPVTDNESEQEMNSVPCTMVNETDHLTCVDNGNCISLNSVVDNIKSTENQSQSSSQTRDLDIPKGPCVMLDSPFPTPFFLLDGCDDVSGFSAFLLVDLLSVLSLVGAILAENLNIC